MRIGLEVQGNLLGVLAGDGPKERIGQHLEQFSSLGIVMVGAAVGARLLIGVMDEVLDALHLILILTG